MSSLTPMTRPDFGTAGEPATVQTNTYEMEFSIKNPHTKFYHYNIEIKDSKGKTLPTTLKKRVFNSIYKLYEGINGGVGPVFDGDCTIFSHVALSKLEGKVLCKSYKLPKEDEEFSFLIEPVEKMEWSLFDLLPLLYGPQSPKFASKSKEAQDDCISLAQRALQGLNVAFRYLLAANCPSNPRAFFPDQAPGIEIPGGVLLKCGFITRLRVGSEIKAPGPPKNLFLSMDVTCGTFLAANPSENPMNSVADLCCRILNIPPPQALRRLSSLNDHDRLKISRVFKRVKIDIFRGAGDKGITKTFGFLTVKDANNETFDTESGKISIADFFQEAWAKRLRFPELPNISMSGGSKKRVYPMELCSVRPGQRYILKLDGTQQVQALNFQTKMPSDRFEDIQKGRDILMDSKHERLLECYGFKLGKKPTAIPARVLQPPLLQYGAGSIPVRNGQWNISQRGQPPQKLRFPAELSSWAVILCLTNHIPRQAVEQFLVELLQKLQSLGMNVSSQLPPIQRLSGSNVAHVRETLQSAGRAALESFQSPPKLFLCITEERSSIYPTIKVEGDLLSDRGVTTQCMVVKHLKNIKDQYLSNLALKINLKIGGLNHTIPLLSQLTGNEPTMIVGVDLTHNNLGSKVKPSIAALVGSMDPSLLKYSTIVGVQPLLEPSEEKSRPRSQEPIQNFRLLISSLLKKWIVNNKREKGPNRLIIFRDGVSDGEFSQVLETEFMATKMALDKICGDSTSCKITYIVCAKKHRIRMNPHPNNADRSGNAPSGTIIDKTIGDPFLFDFFLQSQAGLKGTSRPTRYIVLKDESNYKVDNLQNLVNIICSGFQRATRTVGLATPVYYADIVAGRVKRWLHVDDEPFSSGNTVATTSDNGTQTSEERRNDLESYQQKISEMNKKVQSIDRQMWWS